MMPASLPSRLPVHRSCAGILVVACLLAPSGANAQASFGDPARDPSPDAAWLAGTGSATSPFAGLFESPLTLRIATANAAPVRATLRLPDADAAGAAGPVRSCDGCAPRRPVRAILATLSVNVAFNLMNRLREPNDEFKVSLSSWWDNLRYGFEWDYNSFEINQFGHPYQGGLYFNAGRANGLSFWESAPLAALGSATWEYFGERNHASINDFVTTTMGGIALGEMFHRAGWLIRDARQSGGQRRMREILATAVDPITGLNRFISGDASRVSENPPALKPTRVISDFEIGAQWNGAPNERAVKSAGKTFIGLQLGYNDIFSSPFKVPFDAFTVTLRLGGGSGISEATVRGRLYGRFFGDSQGARPTEFLVAQAYDYESNGIFDYGGQSVVTGVSHLFRLSDSVSLGASGVGGPIVLGAITSPLAPKPSAAEGDAADEVVKRTYDFGPGAEFAAGAMIRVKAYPVVRVAYGGFLIRSVSSIEGVAARHYAQFLRLDGLIPLWKQLRIGVSGSYYNRSVHYHGLPEVHEWLPEFRVFLAKVSR
jgi:hypothetical protein